jgi:hypothetical protein
MKLSRKEFVPCFEVAGRYQKADFIRGCPQICQSVFERQGQGEEPLAVSAAEYGRRFERLPSKVLNIFDLGIENPRNEKTEGAERPRSTNLPPSCPK